MAEAAPRRKFIAWPFVEIYSKTAILDQLRTVQMLQNFKSKSARADSFE